MSESSKTHILLQSVGERQRRLSKNFEREPGRCEGDALPRTARTYCDLHPGNILVNKGRQKPTVSLIEFGIGRYVEQSSAAKNLKQVGFTAKMQRLRKERCYQWMKPWPDCSSQRPFILTLPTVIFCLVGEIPPRGPWDFQPATGRSSGSVDWQCACQAALPLAGTLLDAQRIRPEKRGLALLKQRLGAKRSGWSGRH